MKRKVFQCILIKKNCKYFTFSLNTVICHGIIGKQFGKNNDVKF